MTHKINLLKKTVIHCAALNYLTTDLQQMGSELLILPINRFNPAFLSTANQTSSFLASGSGTQQNSP
jgi:hypothetical protein